MTPAVKRTAAVAASLILWVLLMWGGQYALRGFWEPDEARFVYVAREMIDAGSPAVPYRNGEIYGHKPPLMFWMINLGAEIFPEPFGERLPTLLGTILALASVFGIGKILSDSITGMRAVAILSSSWCFWLVCGGGQIDALLTGLEMSALYLLIRREKENKHEFPAAVFIILGLAVLAKGPVGLIIPLGSYVCFMLAGKRKPSLPASHWIAGIMLALAVPAIWLAFAWASGAPHSYFKEIIFSQNVSRAAGGWGHRQPFYYFLIHAPVEFMPWTLLLPAAVPILARTNSTALKKLSAWALFVILFFSIPSSKRNLYILSAYPAMSLIIASAWDGLENSKMQKRICAGVLLCVTALFALTAGVLAVPSAKSAVCGMAKLNDVIGKIHFLPFIPPLFAAAAGSAAVLASRRNTISKYAIALCAVFAASGTFVLPSMNSVKVPEIMRGLADSRMKPEGRLLFGNLHGESLALHANRRGMRCYDDDEMRAAMASEKEGLAVFRTNAATNIAERFPAVIYRGEFRMGSKLYTWLQYDTGKPQRTEENPDEHP